LAFAETGRVTPLYVSERGRFAVLADARIDNRPELAGRVGRPADAPAAELVGAAYERWGTDCATELEGDFAVIVWDWGRRRLVAARDRLGIRPLFYEQSPNGVLIASDVEQIVVASGSPPRPHPEQVLDDLLWDYRDASRTFLAGIRRIPAAHVLVAEPHGARLTRYWSPRPALVRLPTTADYYARFRELFSRSVQHRLHADGPVLAHLSGGIDSSSVVCAADRLTRGRASMLRAVAGVYPGLECDEDSFVAVVERAVAVPVERWDATKAEYLDLDAPAVVMPGSRVLMNGGSLGDANIARRLGAHVILSGQGGDEIGKPVGIVQDMAANGDWRSLARATFLDKAIPLSLRALRMRVALRGLVPTGLLDAVRSRRRRPPPPSWFAVAARAKMAARPVSGAKGREPGFASSMQARHWEILTAPRLEVILDFHQRYAAAGGFEFRFPFLDAALVEFVLAIPYQHWPAPADYARFHRGALADWLPPQITARMEKVVFGSAIAQKVRGAASRLQDLFGGSTWMAEPYVDQTAARGVLEGVLASPPSSDSPVWNALWSIGTLEAWLRRISEYPLRQED
jgi:asparagine synthase (glutamine-hydrolysing)